MFGVLCERLRTLFDLWSIDADEISEQIVSSESELVALVWTKTVAEFFTGEVLALLLYKDLFFECSYSLRTAMNHE